MTCGRLVRPSQGRNPPASAARIAFPILKKPLDQGVRRSANTNSGAALGSASSRPRWQPAVRRECPAAETPAQRSNRNRKPSVLPDPAMKLETRVARHRSDTRFWRIRLLPNLDESSFRHASIRRKPSSPKLLRISAPLNSRFEDEEFGGPYHAPSRPISIQPNLD